MPVAPMHRTDLRLKQILVTDVQSTINPFRIPSPTEWILYQGPDDGVLAVTTTWTSSDPSRVE